MNEQEYIEKWLHGTLTDEERKLFMQTAEYSSLQRLSSALEHFKAPEFDTASEFEKLNAKRKSQAPSKVIALPWLKPLMQIAAMLFIAACIYFFYSPATDVSTLASENRELYLPDSSNVTLNALSNLTYQSKGWEANRKVELDGEAYFRVAKGSRFDVMTSSGKVSVLGTKFNVVVRNRYFEVVCYEGRVRVASSTRALVLTPGHVFRIVDGVVSAELLTKDVAPSWLNQESSFESVPFNVVIGEFERQYGVKVDTKNVNTGRLFTGRFGHSDINLALKSISIPLDLEYKIDEVKKTVLLFSGDK